MSDMVSLRFLILCDSVQTSATNNMVETIVETVLKALLRLGATECRRGEITFSSQVPLRLSPPASALMSDELNSPL